MKGIKDCYDDFISSGYGSEMSFGAYMNKYVYKSMEKSASVSYGSSDKLYDDFISSGYGSEMSFSAYIREYRS